MVLLCRANVTDSDLTLDKFKDLFSPINHIQNNHTYSFLIRSFSPSCWFLLWVSDQSFIFSFGNTSSKICWKPEELFLFGVSPLSFPYCFLLSTLLWVASSRSRFQLLQLCQENTNLLFQSFLLPHVEILCLLCPLWLCFPGCRMPSFHIRANIPQSLRALVLKLAGTTLISPSEWKGMQSFLLEFARSLKQKFVEVYRVLVSSTVNWKT